MYRNTYNNIPNGSNNNYNETGTVLQHNNYVVDCNSTTNNISNDSCSNTGIFEKESTVLGLPSEHSNNNQLYDEQKYRNFYIQLQHHKQLQQQQN